METSLTITFQEVVDLYQIFCFINHLEEYDLKSKSAKALLDKKGYLIDDKQQKEYVLKNVHFKDADNIPSDANNSLEEFVKSCVTLTNNTNPKPFIESFLKFQPSEDSRLQGCYNSFKQDIPKG